MTGKYHVTPSGELKPCKAKQGGCPYGNQPHFNSEQEAQAYINEHNLGYQLFLYNH